MIGSKAKRTGPVWKQYHTVEFGARIQTFLDQCKQYNSWVKCSHLSVYLHKGQRYIDRQMVNAITFANLYVDDMPGLEGAMNVLWIIEEMERICDLRNLALYVENVHNPSLAAFFCRRRGYKEIPCPVGVGSSSFTRDARSH